MVYVQDRIEEHNMHLSGGRCDSSCICLYSTVLLYSGGILICAMQGTLETGRKGGWMGRAGSGLPTYEQLPVIY